MRPITAIADALVRRLVPAARARAEDMCAYPCPGSDSWDCSILANFRCGADGHLYRQCCWSAGCWNGGGGYCAEWYPCLNSTC